MTIRYNIDGKERVHVESYVLYEWVEEVQEVTQKGYKLCLENDRFPHSYVGYYSAYFDKPDSSISLSFTGKIPTLIVPANFMAEGASPTEKAVYEILKRAIGEISSLYQGDGAVQFLQGWEVKVDTSLSTEEKEWLDADLSVLLVDEDEQKAIEAVENHIEEQKALLAEEIAAKNVEDAQEQAANSQVIHLSEKDAEWFVKSLVGADEVVEQTPQSPAEQVNNQDADTATDVGAFPQREAEPAPQPERPARRGRPPRNAQ